MGYMTDMECLGFFMTFASRGHAELLSLGICDEHGLAGDSLLTGRERLRPSALFDVVQRGPRLAIL